MKKFFQLLVMLLMLGSSQLALAYSDKATISEGADIVSVERLAIAAPLYFPLKDSPTMEQLVQLLNESSAVSKHTVITYDIMVQNLMRDKNVDLLKTDRHVSAKIFRDNIANYADAYMILTVANNSRTVFFFDVYAAGTNEMMYSYQIIAERGDPDDVKNYTMMAQKFYKNFDASVEEQRKQQEKDARDARERAKKEAERAEKERKG